MFDIIFLETGGCNDSLRASEVRPQTSGIVSVTPDMLLAYTPLHVYSFNGSDYIKLKCDIWTSKTGILALAIRCMTKHLFLVLQYALFNIVVKVLFS